MLIDTGSEVTILSKSVYDSIAFRPVLQPWARPLFSANGKQITLHGLGMLPIQFVNPVLTCQCLVADVKATAMLSIDTLEAYGFSLDMTTTILMSSMSFTIPKSEAIIACHVSRGMNHQTVLIDAPGGTGISHPNTVSRTLASPQTEEAMVQLLNPSPCSIGVNEGDRVAQCETIKKIYDISGGNIHMPEPQAVSAVEGVGEKRSEKGSVHETASLQDS